MSQLDKLCVDAVRVLSMDAVQRANSGHPGAPMGLAPVGYSLFTRHLRHSPGNPAWWDRDRFVLSAGHASMFLYSLLHLSGYDLPLEELKAFRQWGSRTAGHPEVGHTPGVETTTGPLGQGVANSVGMAIAERWLAARFNRPGHEVINHRTWVVCSDGDLMEGVSQEALELAGHLGLGKLIWIFDDNEITIEGAISLASSTDQKLRFEASGWRVLDVADGTDLAALDAAFAAAGAPGSDRPTLVRVRTVIAQGSPNKAGSEKSHGSPLGDEEIRLTKEALGYPSQEPFWVDPEARAEWARVRERGSSAEAVWQERWELYRATYPCEADELDRMLTGTLPEGWSASIPDLSAPRKGEATRVSSGRVLQAVAGVIPELIGGSADLAGSNNSNVDGAPDFLRDTPEGRNFHFGVREHAMGSILNGMALHGGVRPYGATFLIFSEYMRPAIRMAALMGQPALYLFTHDSIGLGEDGPTHQPVEQLPALRAIPNLLDLRPGDAQETAEAWKVALERTGGPTFLSLTRQALPALEREASPAGGGVARGGYIFREASGGAPHAILIASGSELALALEARDLLEAEGVPTRVVSLPSWFLFSHQPAEWRESVLPASVRARVSVEAAASFGWERWIGLDGRAVALDHFGASAPAEILFREFGFTPERIAGEAKALLAN
jgi:transketolase